MPFFVSDVNRVFLHTHAPAPVRRVWRGLAYWFDHPDGTELRIGRLAIRGLTVGGVMDALLGLHDAKWIRLYSIDGVRQYQIGMPAAAVSFAERGEKLGHTDFTEIARMFPYPNIVSCEFVAVWPDPITKAA